MVGRFRGDCLIGAAATRQAVLERLPHHDVVHFAVHGLQGEDGFAPRPALPDLVRGDDGFLRAPDVARLRLPRCRLAVLGARRSAGARAAEALRAAGMAARERDPDPRAWGAFLLVGSPETTVRVP